VAGEQAGDDDRVGEQRPSAGREQPVPFPEHGRPVGQVVDRVDADDGVEAGVLERQRPAGVGLMEAGEPVEALPPGQLAGGLDRVAVAVDADDLGASRAGQPARRPAGPAGHVQHPRPGGQPQPAQRGPPLVDRQPAVLAQVVPVGVQPHLLAGPELEAAVGGVEEAYLVGHCCSLPSGNSIGRPAYAVMTSS
jgi:hypothetical protein